MEILNAVGIGETTLLGFLPGNRPQEHGNCFGVHIEGGGDALIVNFNYENLEALLKEHKLPWPIKVGILGITSYGRRIGVIHDERIAHRWYQRQWCTCCCPEEMLPITQQLQHQREELLGSRRRVDVGAVYDHTKRAPFGELPVSNEPLNFKAVEVTGMSFGHTAALARVDFE